MAQGQEQLVKYIVSEHKYIQVATRQLKTLDPRVILATGVEDETLTLRLATAHPAIFEYLWSTFPDLYSFDTHLDPILHHLASQDNSNFLQSLYAHSTT